MGHELHSGNTIRQDKGKREEKLSISCAGMNISVEVWDQGFILVSPCDHPMLGGVQGSEQSTRLVGVLALAWNPHLEKDGVQPQQGIPDLILCVQPFSCEAGCQDQDQGPHPKAAQVNGKTLIVFSELWIRPRELSHTLNGTLFEAKQAQGFIHVEVLTVQ